MKDRTSAIVSALEKLADNLPGDDGISQATLRDAADRLDELSSICELPCHWRVDATYDGTYAGTCGAEWVFAEGDPESHGMRFCPVCGGELVVEEGAK